MSCDLVEALESRVKGDNFSELREEYSKSRSRNISETTN